MLPSVSNFIASSALKNLIYLAVNLPWDTNPLVDHFYYNFTFLSHRNLLNEHAKKLSKLDLG